MLDAKGGKVGKAVPKKRQPKRTTAYPTLPTLPCLPYPAYPTLPTLPTLPQTDVMVRVKRECD